MRTRHVVTAFLLHPEIARPRIVLGRRSRAVRTYPGRWAAISGSLPPYVAPETQARRELREELGPSASRLRFLLEGSPIAAADPALNVRWIVHPFLFQLRGDPALHGNWEHSRLAWIDPADLSRRATVPALDRAWERVAWVLDVPPPLLRAAQQIRRDHRQGSSALARLGLQALASPRWSVEEVRLGARALAAARPAMAAIAVGAALAAQAKARAGDIEALIRVADARREALADAVATAVHGAVLTHSYSGSVLEGLRAAIAAGRVQRVIVTESQPGGEGRATAAALAPTEVGILVIPDSAGAAFVAEADCLLIGADACYRDGSILNKVGTRGLAVAARAAGIPVYVALESTKIRPRPQFGPDWEYQTVAVPRRTGTSEARPTFDLTDAALIDALITELGPLDRPRLRALAHRHERALRALWSARR